MSALIDITGRRFGRLVASSKHRSVNKRTLWFCKCDCGVTKFVLSSNLIRGLSKSCGCLIADTSRKHGATTDKSRRRFYGVWRGVLDRCRNPRSKAFKWYGARGITVCEEWHSFVAFEADMWPGYKRGLQLDRIDNDKGYYKDNCRWTTSLVNNNNTRRNLRLTLNGECLTAPEWARRTGIGVGTIHSRVIRGGWTDEQALTASIKKGHRHDI